MCVFYIEKLRKMCYAIFDHIEGNDLLEAKRNSRFNKMEVRPRSKATGYARRTAGWQNMADEGVWAELL